MNDGRAAPGDTPAGGRREEGGLRPGRRLGRQVLIDLYDCPREVLDNEKLIASSMIAAAREAGAAVVDSTFHRFSPCGVSGVVFNGEATPEIYTWPEFGYAAVDLFTCGDGVDPWIAHDALKRALGAGRGEAIELPRPGGNGGWPGGAGNRVA